MKKRVISILTVMLFMSVILTGCYKAEEDPWAEYKVLRSDAKILNLNRYYLIKQNRYTYLFMDCADSPATTTQGGYLVYSDTPAFVFENGDAFVYFYGLGNKYADKISLMKVNPPTGALNFYFYYLYDKTGKTSIDCFDSDIVMEEQSMITDKDGNEIGDVYNNMYHLNVDETYTVRIEEGGRVFEEQLTADWLFYSCDNWNDVITIHPDLTNKSYATYDFSSLDPGYYAIRDHAYNIIEIR